MQVVITLIFCVFISEDHMIKLYSKGPDIVYHFMLHWIKIIM